jgi:hypothetical protein
MVTGLQQGSWGRGARNLVLKPITRDGAPAGARGGLRARHRRAPHGPPGPAPGLGAQTGPRLDACIEHWCSPSRKTQLMQGREGPAIDSRLPLRRRRRRHRPRRRRHRGAAAPTCAAPFKLIRVPVRARWTASTVDGLHSKGAGHNNSAGRIRNIYTSVNHSFVSWNTMELQACVGHSCERAAASCNYYYPGSAVQQASRARARACSPTPTHAPRQRQSGREHPPKGTSGARHALIRPGRGPGPPCLLPHPYLPMARAGTAPPRLG